MDWNKCSEMDLKEAILNVPIYSKGNPKIQKLIPIKKIHGSKQNPIQKILVPAIALCRNMMMKFVYMSHSVAELNL